jgi:hypothetical protein
LRDLVRDRGCRLYYYATSQEVQFANAIDQATTFIQGTGHQMELEAIRSRTREALRSRVRNGQIAGGPASATGSSAGATPPPQAHHRHHKRGRGARRPPHLHRVPRPARHPRDRAPAQRDGVPAPAAGRRGSGSWAPGAVRTILLNPRYRGIYVHGRIKKLRQGGGTVRVKAEPHELITVERSRSGASSTMRRGSPSSRGSPPAGRSPQRDRERRQVRAQRHRAVPVRRRDRLHARARRQRPAAA